MIIEILPPDADVPAAVAVPKVTRIFRNDTAYYTELQLRDGGVWAISDRTLHAHRIDLRRVALEEVFAHDATLFNFVGRFRRAR